MIVFQLESSCDLNAIPRTCETTTFFIPTYSSRAQGRNETIRLKFRNLKGGSWKGKHAIVLVLFEIKGGVILVLASDFAIG
jgi:hypothetical protein